MVNHVLFLKTSRSSHFSFFRFLAPIHPLFIGGNEAQWTYVCGDGVCLKMDARMTWDVPANVDRRAGYTLFSF